ncbi:hypothetical protein QQ045_017764 [Rhodiola kirilowii]
MAKEDAFFANSKVVYELSTPIPAKETSESSSAHKMEDRGGLKKFKGKKRPNDNTFRKFKKKPKGSCLICGKLGHYISDFRLAKDVKGIVKKNVGERAKEQGPSNLQVDQHQSVPFPLLPLSRTFPPTVPHRTLQPPATKFTAAAPPLLGPSFRKVNVGSLVDKMKVLVHKIFEMFVLSWAIVMSGRMQMVARAAIGKSSSSMSFLKESLGNFSRWRKNLWLLEDHSLSRDK